MNELAAIAAQLVDMRNVGTHKVLKLTIHIPEEQALAAIAAFGWPTGVDPVPIAIARLVEQPAPDVVGKVANVAASGAAPLPGGAKTAFRDMRMANQAGMLCDTPAFQKFLFELTGIPMSAAEAAEEVRKRCGVATRSDIRPRTPSGDRWTRLVEEYRTWMHMPELAS